MKTFKRKIWTKFSEWKKESEGNTALLVEGARRIGKSTAVEEFAKQEYESYILIDFSIASKKIKDLFNDLSDLNAFFRLLQFYTGKELIERKSLIIFDEVQLFPLARQAIKVLVKDHRYDYIETGSLLSIKENVKDILIPSEERSVQMHPMDYEEFCWAIGQTNIYEMGRSIWGEKKSLGDDVNRELMRTFRLYMIVGGMPQAVDTFLETNNFCKVDLVKRDILKLYENDFMKFDSTGRASLLFDSIPAELKKNASRYQISSVIENARAATMLDRISKLQDSKTVNLAYHANAPEAGLSQNIDLEKFKLFVCDTGLFVTLCFKDKEFTENIIYEKLLSDKLPANLGFVYENIIAQMLTAKGDKLYYHTFPSQTSNHNYEVDFIISRQNKICPIEAKSADYKKHKSLDIFTQKFSRHIGTRFLIYTKEYRKDSDIFCIPMYLVPFI
ncbi:ATP-binding protein [Treponema sp. C6A8]|uniref:ATP-binding protein n=1 Tax=Treponema sp. C6A8 TaxID=1410609 RepID=UPI0004880319|nr:AAA family ATPase [Treponema sp. C6A8]